MDLQVLPTRSGGAAENMAIDFLLLQRFPAGAENAPRFRHYGWHRPAFTFGYSQKIGFVREQLAARVTDTPMDLCRRPTGGGIVDHREDWTYALVIPRGHPLEERRASESYRAVHAAIAAALHAQGIPAELKPCDDATASCRSDPVSPAPAREVAPAGVCFERAETFDVVHGESGAKIAGAAQKRNKHGLLFQGSLWRPAVGVPVFDWEQFEADFIEQLAHALGAAAAPTPWPDFNEDELAGLTEQYASPEWLEHR